MAALQEEIIQRLGVKPVIDPPDEIRKRVDFLKTHMLEASSTGLLISIKGGVEDAVAAGLCKCATDELSAETGKDYMTLGVFQPYDRQADMEDSYSVAKAFGLKHVVETNIEDAVDEIALEVEYGFKGLGIHRHMSLVGKGSMKARTRMVMQYALAEDLNLLVAGSAHASDAMTGSLAKWGDGAVDIAPLRSLTKRQILLVAAELGVPDSVIHKRPAAGPGEGRPDEIARGVSYDELSDYLEGKTIAPDSCAKLEKHYLKKDKQIYTDIPGI